MVNKSRHQGEVDFAASSPALLSAWTLINPSQVIGTAAWLRCSTCKRAWLTDNGLGGAITDRGLNTQDTPWE